MLKIMHAVAVGLVDEVYTMELFVSELEKRAPKTIRSRKEINTLVTSEIFWHHVTAFDLVPEATLFIDDVAANVEAAQIAGWLSVQFVGPDRLRHDLRSLDVIV